MSECNEFNKAMRAIRRDDTKAVEQAMNEEKQANAKKRKSKLCSMHSNFRRIHKMLRVTPVMEGGRSRMSNSSKSG